MRTLSGINFNYTYMFRLVLVIRTYFDKNLIYQEIQAARILIKQKPSWQIYWTTSTPLCLIVQIADFGKKTPQTHLIIIREWPKNTPPPPILRNLDTPPWCILFHPPPLPHLLQLGTKEYYIKYNNKYTNSCYIISFLHNFKLSYHWLKIFAGGWVTISCDWVSLSETSVCLEEYYLLYKWKILIYWY